MQGPVSTPPSDQPDRATVKDDAAAVEPVRQGRIVLRTRAERMIFAAGLGTPVVVLLVLWLTHLL